MNRYDIAKGKKPVIKKSSDYDVPEGFLKKCQIFKNGKIYDCLLRNLNVDTDTSRGFSYKIEAEIQVPHDLYIEINHLITLKMKEQEFKITPTKIDYNFQNNYIKIFGQASFERASGFRGNISRR
jgi:hypothetical protein